MAGVERSRYLPHGGDWQSVCNQYAPELADAIRRVPKGEYTVADDRWAAEYERLETRPESVYGAATSRLAVRALRVAMLYAALDGSKAILPLHL